ncbi:MAG: hypothetical protein J7L82_06745 [Staphylothermus sp.]|nr:hypothetical protein [Staphylothermus sp.]
MPYILVIDIGKTKTFAIIVDSEYNVYCKAVSGAAGIILDKEDIIGNLSSAINECLSKAGISINDLDLISISWSDLDTEKDRERARSIVREMGLPIERTIVEHDAVSAYYAVTWGKPGIAVIAGTGAIAFGINKKGERARSSGWGWIIGDEGSACWIAQRALNAASRAYDGRGPYTTLVERIKEYYNVNDLLDILNKVYTEQGSKPGEIAKLAKIVDEEARNGDPVAIEILKDAGKELALSAISVAKKLNMEEDDIIIGGVGSVFSSSIVLETFREYIRKSLRRAIIKEPIISYKAIMGPLIIALLRIGVTITEKDLNNIIERIEQY